MFERYSYKQKLIALSILLVLLLITANKRSFKVTAQAYQQLQEVRGQLEFMRMSGQGSMDLQEQLERYDRVIGKQHVDPGVAQQSILDFATNYDDVSIAELKETHFSQTKGFDVVTNQLILQGDYSSLSRVVYAYEKSFDVSSLVGIQYFTEKNFNKRTKELKVLLIFQNYEKNK